MNRSAGTIVGLLLFVLCPGSPSAAPAQGIAFSLVRETVRIPAGQAQGQAELVLQASVEGTAPVGLPKVTDSSTPPSVTFEVQPLSAATSGKVSWRLFVTVKEMPTAGTTLFRTLNVAWGPDGTAPTSLKYWLSNSAVTPPTLKVLGLPGEWQVSALSCQRVRIFASGARLTGLTVTNTLTSTTSKEAVGDNLFLSVDGTTAAGATALEIAVNDHGDPVYICTRNLPGAGQYDGVVTVSSFEKPDGDSVSVKLSVTSTALQFWGLVVLIVGCGLAFLLKQFIPSLLTRQQSLLAAGLITEHLNRIRARLVVPAGAAQLTRGRIDARLVELSPVELVKRGYVSGAVPNPFGNGPNAAGLKQLLDDATNEAQLLAILVDEGFHNLQPGSPATALKDLDDLAPGLTSTTVANLRAGISRALGLPAPGPAGVDEPRSETDRLLIQIQTTSAFVWFVVAIVSAAIGYAVLVASKAGFGTSLDFVYCFLWGFGISAGQQLTATTVQTAIGIQVPKNG